MRIVFAKYHAVFEKDRKTGNEGMGGNVERKIPIKHSDYQEQFIYVVTVYSFSSINLFGFREKFYLSETQNTCEYKYLVNTIYPKKIMHAHVQNIK